MKTTPILHILCLVLLGTLRSWFGVRDEALCVCASLEELPRGDTEWEQVVLCGGVFVGNTILEHEEEEEERGREGRTEEAVQR